MKIQIKNYKFNKTAKTITFSDYDSIKIENVLAILNQGVFIFNCADSSLLGTVQGNVLTVAYNTSAMNDSDPLQILYEDSDAVTYTDMVLIFRQMLAVLANPPTTDKSINQIRTAPQSIPNLSTNTLGTVTTVVGLNNIDGQQGKLVPLGMNVVAWQNLVRTLIT